MDLRLAPSAELGVARLLEEHGVARDETAEDAEASVDHTPGAGARVAARAGTASKRVAAASSKPVRAPPAKRPETPAKRSV